MSQRKVSVIGLGYVGLPVAVEFSKKYEVVGFDINKKRIDQLNSNIDLTNEVTSEDLKSSNVTFSDDIEVLKKCDFHIIAVPTPIDDYKKPDLTPLIGASKTVGKALKKGDIVVYESTVYPGVSEEICLPVLEEVSGLKGGVDFKIGYSPERINPGDKEHSFTKITKVVSGQDKESLKIVSQMYSSVVTAGVHEASSIKVAEAAKVIENTQRDLNIALMNELSIIFDLMDIDTKDVLAAAGTKWNFIKFTPGLVGGHCIGVDPYYLTHKAEYLGYHPEVILSGRRINDNMGKFVAEKTVKQMIKSGKKIKESTITVLGLTFKENCPDLRNSRVFDIVNELIDYNANVQLCDPLIDKEDKEIQGYKNVKDFDQLEPADAIILAVPHSIFKEMRFEGLLKISKSEPIIIDVKGIYDQAQAKENNIDSYWRL